MSHRSLGRPLVALLALLAGALLAVAPPALADPGPAPAPREYRVLQKLHTDAVSTFLDAGAFQLGSKADVPEGLGTRLDPDTLWFHVDDASRMTTPAGMEFIAPPGSTVWIAPQSNPSGAQLWPGFSTESIPVGAIEGDTTTLRLADFEGPGTLELFTNGAFGEITRLWSSDEQAHRSFQVSRTHMHANWAFTQPGTYRITVEATVRIAGQPASATATYTFVVGPLPEKAATTTTLTASKTALEAGESVTLTGTVAPGAADGFVEFRRGATVLGHDRVESGSAELQVSDLPVGTHDVTAVFVPAVANLAAGSTSAPLSITVSDPSGQPFSVTGVKAAYQPGETLSARVVGATLKENETFRWLLRYKGTTSTIVPQSTTADTYSQLVDALQDDAEIGVQLYDTAARVTKSETPWIPIVIDHQGGQPVITQVGTAHDPLLPGDAIVFEVGGRPLAEGETLEWGFSTYAGYFGASFGSAWPATYLTENQSRVRLLSQYNPTAVGPYAPPLVVSVVKDGVRIARSEFTTISVGPRELGVQGHRNLYREGGRVELDATLYPLRDGAGDDFTFTWTFTKGTTTEVWGSEQQASPALQGPVLTTAQHDGGQLRLSVFNRGELAQRSASLPISVTDDLTTQILEFSALAAHYHQGDRIRLTLTADPAPLPGETLRWEWKWPGGDWQPMPGVVDNVWDVTAEQAIDGLDIRAVLTYADPATPPAIAPTRTVHVDDHGAAPRQTVTVTGPAAVEAGGAATLTASVAPASILDRYQWYVQRPGAAEATPIAGATGATYAFTAAPADDGNQYTAALVKPDGSVAYGPSAPLTLDVRASATTVEQPIGGTVGPVLALELGTAPSLGTFQPGVARTYSAQTDATVTTTLRDTRLIVSDPSAFAPGHLVNGDAALAAPLGITADGGAFAPLTTPVTLRTFPRAVAGEPVTIAFEQAIGAREGIDAGSYAKTLTFTLTTATP